MAKNNTDDTVNSVIDRFIDEDSGAGDTGEDTTTSAEGAEADGAGDGDAESASATGTETGGDPNDAGRTSDSKGSKGDSAGKQSATGKGTEKGKTSAGPKDLVDPNTGQVLAKAGHERRVWESASKYTRDQYNNWINSKVQPRMNELQRVNAEYKGKLDAYEANNATAAQLQITPQEVGVGMKLVAALKKDPAATIDYLIEQAKANGHNIDLSGKMAGIDANAISRMVDGKLQPIITEQQNREQVQRAYSEAGNELSQFYERYPTARVNEETLDGLLQKFPELTLETAYLKLSNYMLANGMDPNQSIKVQMEARSKGVKTDPGRRGPGNPGGRGNPGVVANNDRNAPVRFAHEDTSYKDIVRDAMREAGVSVN